MDVAKEVQDFVTRTQEEAERRGFAMILSFSAPLESGKLPTATCHTAMNLPQSISMQYELFGVLRGLSGDMMKAMGGKHIK